MHHKVVVFCLAILGLMSVAPQSALSLEKSFTNIIDTPHNLSVTGPGDIHALTETRICVFCHTPHNAQPKTPLWNKQIKEGVSYTTYSSTTMAAQIPQPTGPTRLCLSCHDGTIALGEVLSEPTGIDMNMEIESSRRSYIGTDISDDHPVSFSYADSLPNNELAEAFPEDLRQYNGNVIHCSTCHDPHDNTFGKFLAQDNTYSALCVRCHQMEGWNLTSHRTSDATWNGVGTDPWPRTPWATVMENGCENCHSPHRAAGKKRLLNYAFASNNCIAACHNGRVGEDDVTADLFKLSGHMVNGDPSSYDKHDASEQPTAVRNHVECVDCHNPHAAFGSSRPPAPFVSASLAQVSGVDQQGQGVDPASFEYEICFKCHGDLTTASPYISRVVNESNTRLEFNPLNPSYHPVVVAGRNFSLPSLPSSYEPTLTASSRIFCTDCHDSDDSPVIGGVGIRGPHGSNFKPLLRQNYETADGTIESFTSYELCYHCHDRQKILADLSFRANGSGNGGHGRHLTGHGQPTGGATCSVCHDPHGVYDDGMSGHHTHLINFDRSLVQPVSGQAVPYFIDQGERRGACVLVCHQFTHTEANSQYPGSF